MTDIVGGAVSGAEASKGRRVVAAVFDLVFVPMLIGFVAAVILLPAPEAVRYIVLGILNVAWLVVRDGFWSPGRKLTGIKLVSQTGSGVTVIQALIRNLLLIIPFVLLVGYFIELIALIVSGNRLGDKWAKTKTVSL